MHVERGRGSAHMHSGEKEHFKQLSAEKSFFYQIWLDFETEEQEWWDLWESQGSAVTSWRL